MEHRFRYGTVEEAKQAILSTLQSEGWKDVLCSDRDGNKIEYYFDRETVVNLARWIPSGRFDSWETCYRLLQQCLLEHLDAIATFVAGKGPLRSITVEYDHPVGAIVQWESDTQVSEKPCDRVNLILCRNDRSVAGFYVSDFVPVLR